jgi:ABC-2 type transport system ATP-binding protein
MMPIDSFSPAPLQLSDIAVSYGKRLAVSDVSLRLAAGERFGLIGLNGAGKTTLIRAILALNPCAGDVHIFGTPHHKPAARQHVGYLPEKFMPPAQLTGYEYVALSLKHYRLRMRKAALQDLAAGLGFPVDFLNKPARTYSKGMGQKVGLMAALASRLPLLILDEPMSGLDPKSRVLLKDRLLDYCADGGTLFFSSHILADIHELCDRIAVLNPAPQQPARLIYTGAPDGLIAQTNAETLERAFLALIDDDTPENGA